MKGPLILACAVAASGCQSASIDRTALTAPAGASAEIIPGVRLGPLDARIPCPPWLDRLSSEAEAKAMIANGTCIRTTSADAKQKFYIDELKRAGWSLSGGLANVFAFRRAGECLLMTGFPLEGPRSEAVGSERDLTKPRPGDIAALFLFARAEPAQCDTVA